MRVFLIEEPRSNIDLSTARDFGNLHILFPMHEHRTSVFNCSEFGDQVIDRLRGLSFNPAVDSVCVAGSMITMIVAISSMIREFKSINVLFFNATINHYVKRTLCEKND